jgi:hypothetical protein
MGTILPNQILKCERSSKKNLYLFQWLADVKVSVFRKAMAQKTELLRKKISEQSPLGNGQALRLEFELVAMVVAQAVMNPSEHKFHSRNIIASQTFGSFDRV